MDPVDLPEIPGCIALSNDDGDDERCPDCLAFKGRSCRCAPQIADFDIQP